MSYAQFKKDHHSEWPQRMADLEGRKVKLLRDMATRGGETFCVGRVLTVRGVHRGKLYLLDEKNRGLRQINPSYVELLP